MKKVLLFVVIFLILTWPSDSTLVRPKVSADDFIFEPDSLSVAALMTMIHSDESIPPKPDDSVSSECKCANGKVSYDGGRSLATCPCGVNGGKCNCADCPYNKVGDEIVVSDVVTDDYLNEYSIIKVTAPWCGPCRSWDNALLPKFEKAGIKVNELNYDNNKSIAQDALISSIPYFMIQTKVDSFYHHMPNDKNGKPCGVYGAGGQDFSVLTAKNLMAELDKSIHPNRSEGLFYNKQQTKETKLNGKFWASKKEYIVHLRNNNNHKDALKTWPLEKLSVYELKAIHDDHHAGKLGGLNGI